MNDTLFKRLLDSPESAVLDFKSACYDFARDKDIADAKFIKDILAMSNTVRSETAYIIFGVSEDGGRYVASGVADFADDAIFQQKAIRKVLPRPVFQAYRYRYDGKIFGVLEIPPHPHEGPLVATAIMKGIEPDMVYTRMGSSNTPASYSQMIAIQQWLRSMKRTGDRTDTERKQLIANLTNVNVLLSAVLGQCVGYAQETGDQPFMDFCKDELNGYAGKLYKDLSPAHHRWLKAPATPYDIAIPNWRSVGADRAIRHLSAMKECQVIPYFYQYPVFELERALKNIAEQENIVTVRYPVAALFPQVRSNIPLATIFIGPQSLHELYDRIRQQILSFLTSAG